MYSECTTSIERRYGGKPLADHRWPLLLHVARAMDTSVYFDMSVYLSVCPSISVCLIYQFTFAFYICTYIFISTDTGVCTYMYIRMYKCMYVCMYACMYVCMYVQTHIFCACTPVIFVKPVAQDPPSSERILQRLS